MIRINLLKSVEGSLRTATLVGAQELGIGAVLLAAASAVLLYLSLTVKPPARVAAKPAERAPVAQTAGSPAGSVQEPRALPPPGAAAAPQAGPAAATAGSPPTTLPRAAPAAVTQVAPPPLAAPPRTAPAAAPGEFVAPPRVVSPPLAAPPRTAPAAAPGEFVAPPRVVSPPPAASPRAAPAAAPGEFVAPPRVVSPPPAASPQGAPAATPTGGFRLTGISIQPHAAGLSVRLEIDPQATWRATELRNPHRLVVDIANTRLAIPRPQLTQAIDHPVVRRVRSSQFQRDPAVSRVVLDLDSPARHEIRSGPAGLEILVGDGKR